MLEKLIKSGNVTEIDAFLASVAESESAELANQYCNQKNEKRYYPIHVAIFTRYADPSNRMQFAA
jgi:hypothetical protein